MKRFFRGLWFIISVNNFQLLIPIYIESYERNDKKYTYYQLHTKQIHRIPRKYLVA